MIRSPTGLAIVAAIVVLAFAPVAAAEAQVVRGMIATGSPHRPLSGVVVTGRDSAGATITRTLSDSSGAFRIETRRLASLRVTRIGFAPVEVSLARFTGVVVMQPISVALSAVRVTGRAVCPESSGRAQVVAAWEQAREALLAAVVAREARPADAQLFLYERALDAGGRRVLSETRRTRDTRTSRPFIAAASASTFASLGYMREHNGDRIFFGPDAEVLLDPTFAETHCFAVVRNEERPDDVGLQFTPARERAGVVDVRGTLWLRREDPRIEDVEFSYTGIDGVTSSRQAGGVLEFATVPNGVTLLSRWAIRMPLIVVRGQQGSVATGTGNAATSSVTGVHETGGVVMTAAWADGSRYAPVFGRIVGVVQRLPDGMPVRGATVRLDATGVTATSDSLGGFVLSAPLSGRYDVTATDTTIPWPLPELTVTAEAVVAEGRDAAVRLRFPGDAAVARAMCDLVDGGVRPSPGARRTGTIVGRVAVPGGSPSGMYVTSTWLAQITIGHGVVRTGETTLSMELDSTGTFVLCDVVAERDVRLTARRGQVLLVDTALKVPDGAPLIRVALTADLASRARLAQQLAPVEVSVDRTALSPQMREFEARRQSGFGGYFIDELAMRKTDAPIAMLIPRFFPGVRVVLIDTRTYLTLARGGAARELMGEGPKNCWIDIYVDGIQQFGDRIGDPVDVSRIGTHTLAAAEFYAGGASVPPQFNRTANNCGVLLLWSRER